MATNLIKAADDARRILKGFKAFAEVADALEAAGQVEQRAAEATETLAALLPKIAEARAEAQAAKDAGFAHTEAAAARAAEIIAKAEDTAKAAVADANAAVAQANAKREAVRAETQALVDKHRELVADAQSQRDALLAEVEALEARLAKAKGQVAKLLG